MYHFDSNLKPRIRADVSQLRKWHLFFGFFVSSKHNKYVYSNANSNGVWHNTEVKVVILHEMELKTTIVQFLLTLNTLEMPKTPAPNSMPI